jgi:DNA polymerase III delta prime subunit
MEKFDNWLETKMDNQKICFIMRGIPGSGKSTTAKELLKKHGGTPDGHIFATDNWFHPIANKLRALGHITPESLSLETAWEFCEEIKKFWFSVKWTKVKADAEDSFLEFKALADKNKYYEALTAAQQMAQVLEIVEYRSNWHGSKLKAAHSDNLTKFKLAVDQGVTPLIVDNTNITARDPGAYVRYAQAANYDIRIQEPTSPHWTANRDLLSDKYMNRDKLDVFAKELADKNTHGVPLESIKNMMNKWQHNVKVKDVTDAAER